MKKSRVGMISIMVVVLVCFIWMTGCSKKAVQQGDTSGAQTTGATQAAGDTSQKEPEAVKSAEPAAPSTAEGQAKETAKATATIQDFDDIYFDYDKSVLRPQDREILKRHADWLMKNNDYMVLIEGNCDERGTTEYNLALGERRATEAMKYLVGLGVDKDRIKTISYGEERPLDPGHDEAAWAKNRRDHFVIKMK
jgi:peptidoglycan-associated lipoprotein